MAYKLVYLGIIASIMSRLPAQTVLRCAKIELIKQKIELKLSDDAVVFKIRCQHRFPN